MKITPLYTSLLMIIFVILSIRTIRQRKKSKVPIGHADDQNLLRAMRAHSNFSEYVPFSLIGIYLIEMQGAHPLFVHGLGLMILIGRSIHAYGISQSNENFKFRVSGMMLTLSTLIISSLYLLFSIVF
jgi:uncharacterized membrane protein YecN with MAPEG domain